MKAARSYLHVEAMKQGNANALEFLVSQHSHGCFTGKETLERVAKAISFDNEVFETITNRFLHA